MTVGELKKELSQFDDSLEIGGIGHFGELLEIYSVSLDERENEKIVEYERGEILLTLALLNGTAKEKSSRPAGACVKLSIESAGREPD